MAAQKAFKAWEVVRLGTHKDVSALRHALIAADLSFCSHGLLLIDRPAFTVAAKPLRLRLVRASVAELGFKKGARYETICRRIEKLGFLLCPAETGPQLCRQHELPRFTTVIVAMKPIRGLERKLYLFSVERNQEEQQLGTFFGRRARFFPPDRCFVFIQPGRATR